LSYHGFRAKDKEFNATINTDFDESLSTDKAGIGKVNNVPLDIRRILLNLFYNDSFAVISPQAPDKSGQALKRSEEYKLTVSVCKKIWLTK
jgi:two-component system NtrC family sensor kinase